MKDSGIDWIGKIPDEWIVSKAKTILHNKTVKNHPNAEVLSLYRDLGVVPKNSRDDNHNVTSEDTSSYKFVQKGELVLNKMKTWQGSLAVSNYEGIVSPAYYVCEFTNNEIDKNYIHYLLRNKMYAQEFERLSTGLRVGQWDLSIDDFLNTLIIYPPTKSEQTKIAGFLDKKCSEIDSVIEESKKSIEEYKAWKQSVIFEAVTGKNLSCKKKNSGIEWLGEIPETWEIYQLSQVVTQVKNKNTNLQEKNLLSLSYGKIKRKNIDSNDGLLPASFDGYNIIENGDIVLRLTDLQNDHTSLRVGRATEKGIITSAYTTLRPMNKDNSRFLYYLLHAFDLKKGFYGMGAGVRQGLNYSEVKSLKIILPNDKSEQESIAKFLDKKCAQIDSLISEKQSLIKDLAEYKKSLIFEAVTGKRRV